MIIESNDDVRNLLKDYFERVVEIQGLNHKISLRKDELMPTMVMSMTGMPRGNKVSDPTSETVIKWQEDDEIKALHKRKTELKSHMSNLKAMLNCLTKKEASLLETYYINKHSARVTANRLGIAERSVWRMVDRAISKLKALYDKYYT